MSEFMRRMERSFENNNIIKMVWINSKERGGVQCH
jgi:hypothetical protein